jgi:hypothetical protein
VESSNKKVFAMDLIKFHINWKYYVRNRLLEHLRRIGPDVLFEKLDYKEENKSVAQFVSDLDHTQRSFLHSIEQYAFQKPETEQIFSPGRLNRIPIDKGPGPFVDHLHTNFIAMIDYIKTLQEEDLDIPLEHPVMKQVLEIGWIIQFTTLYEQSVTTGIQTVLSFNKTEMRVPWATAKFMRPVKKLRFK